MQIIRSRNENPSNNPTETFTGEVWMDQVLTDDNITVLDVFFTPNARTYWHTHEIGQLLTVMHGSGYIAKENNEKYAIESGDKVYIPAVEVNNHGEGTEYYLFNTTVSLCKTEYLVEALDNDYNII